MKALLALAASYGVSIHAIHMDAGELGSYEHDQRRINYNIRCTPNEARSVIAHELGHAHFGHASDSEANERQADRFAASLLIDPVEYARLEAIRSDAWWLADELSVTEDVIDCFRALCLQRIGAVTYARPRHGVGQWALKHVIV